MGSMITINLLDPQTLALLRQLEAMKLLEIVEPRPPAKQNVDARNWVGVIKPERHTIADEYFTNIRDEWERDIY